MQSTHLQTTIKIHFTKFGTAVGLNHRCVSRGIFPGLKRPGREADHSFACCVQVKIGRATTSLPQGVA
jgi:hypothetical protein